MKGIDANGKTLRDILDKVKYTVDFFQREYRWEKKQIEQLIDDLTSKFLSNYKESHERKEVNVYEKYYLVLWFISSVTYFSSCRRLFSGGNRLHTVEEF